MAYGTGPQPICPEPGSNKIHRLKQAFTILSDAIEVGKVRRM
jgi:hypothetical protein